MSVTANESIACILIVDDEINNLKLLSSLLTSNNYKVRAAKTGEEALSSIQSSLPDLILLDIRLPDISGYDVCISIKSNISTKDLPVLFLSSLIDTNDIVKGFKVGAQDFITKPFKAEEVLARVNTHLQLSLLRKKLEMQANELKVTNEKLEKEIYVSQQVEFIRQKNKELADANAAKDKFFSIIGHDLKGPFVGFLGLTEMMLNPNITLEEVREISKLMNKSAENLSKLLENLLTWARMQKGAIEYKPEACNLSTIINQNLADLNDFAKQKNINMTREVPSNITINVDIAMINIVFRNLISNAIKFTERGGKVIVCGKEEKEEVLVFVRDSGIGMNEKILDGIFKIDQKTSRPGTEKESSTGLGLLLCKEFIEKHTGKIWAESEVDKGSTFYFTIRK